MKDQLFGSHGGIERLSVLSDHAFVVRLSADVPGVGREISVVTAKPLECEMLRSLRRLERRA